MDRLPRLARARARALVFAGSAAGALLLPGMAAAAAVTAVVTDRAAHPLADAVVMVAPVGTHLPVKPLTGVQIAQQHRQFQPQVTVITVGTAVSFPNFDTVRHHVYSFSPTKTFELKLYAGVPNAPVVFDKPGIAVLGCNIHDQMAAWVVVADTPFYGRTDANGQLRLEGVPAGRYRLLAWHPRLVAGDEPVATALAVDTADVSQRVQLDVAGAQP